MGNCLTTKFESERVKMKNIFFIYSLFSLCALGAELKAPAFQMSETELLAVLKENKLNDKVTACQELSHIGTSNAVPSLASIINDTSDSALFHSALYALENIRGSEAKTVLKNALAVIKDSTRRGSIEKTLRARTNPIPDGYIGASEKITALPPKSAIQNGDLSYLPTLIEKALAKGPEATLARRHLVGFPNSEIKDILFKMTEGEDTKKARLALDVLGDRRDRSTLPRLLKFAKSTKNKSLRQASFNALASLCDIEDLPQLLELLKLFPKEDRLFGAIIRIVVRAFETDTTPVTIFKAEYGNFGEKHQTRNVLSMIRSLVESGSRAIMSSNRLAGEGGFAHDPAPGMKKELRLTYCVGTGPKNSAVVKENDEIQLTDLHLPENPAKELVSAAKASTGDLHDSLIHIISAVSKRGIVPGAEDVLFRPIFNGKDLSGWSQQDGFFSVKDGMIVGESTAERLCKPNHHLVYTAEEFSDFELRAEFRLSKSANSGIQLRCKAQYINDNGYQADMNGGGNYVGFLYHPKQHLIGKRGADVAIDESGKTKVDSFADSKELQKLFRPEQWNDMRVKVEGRKITVWINGVRTTSVEDPRLAFFPDKGHIALQLHQGPPMKVEFRNLRLRR
jgi:hypothetical protein